MDISLEDLKKVKPEFNDQVATELDNLQVHTNNRNNYYVTSLCNFKAGDIIAIDKPITSVVLPEGVSATAAVLIWAAFIDKAKSPAATKILNSLYPRNDTTVVKKLKYNYIVRGNSFYLMYLYSFINHSCRPNAIMVPTEDSLILLAIEPIVIGKEITVNYISSREPNRLRLLQSTYGFTCRCGHCDNPRSDKICVHCFTDNPKFTCGDCKMTKYCSRYCQKKDWSTHKKICHKI